MAPMKNVLVTGGAGFIGSHIVDFLINKNYKVRVLDNLSTGSMKNVEHNLCKDNFEFVWGDISDINSVRKACDGIDLICHQAALGSVPRSIDDPLTSHKSNVNGFLNVLMSAREHNIKRVVYASSSSVYGDDENLPKVENVIGKQLSPYAVTKYIDELYARVFVDLYDLECIGLRYFNVFGPRQSVSGPYPAVVPIFVDKLKNKQRPTINGDGSYTRDFTHVYNVAQANFLSLETEDKRCFGEIFNIGDGKQTSILEAFNLIKNKLKIDLDPIFGEVRKGDVPHTKADISKANRLLGYKPQISFVEGVNMMLENTPI
jgi:UDP-N-acetylglucosamine/UDP-N-acetylgalactosamine 4-epimerase